jgi:TRAP-type uncharacterized transport system fused permease subunit
MPPRFETVASTGGLIMLRVMGTAAFIMAEMIGIPYIVVVKAAFIPRSYTTSHCF